MSNAPAPSTEWRESIAPDEEQRYAEYARRFTELQAQRSRRWGPGRALHRKQLCAVHGTLEVLDGLPEFARHGLFAEPGEYETWVRLSNGGMDVASDRTPDIRGFAMRVFGVQGESALGGPAATQDFTLINHEAFAFPNADEFVGFVMAASRGNGELLKYIVRRYGLLGGPVRLGRMLSVAGKSFSGFANETLYSGLPMANGPYAVRVRLVPASTNGRPQPKAREDWAEDFMQRLEKGPLHWDLQLQYFTDNKLTPIEDASVNWTTPYTTVARLMLPQQDREEQLGLALAQRVEASTFDPWHSLAQHRPLGDVQRARKAVYFASQKGRGAA